MPADAQHIHAAPSLRTPADALASACAQLRTAETVEQATEIIRTTARRLIGSDGIALILREEDHCRYVAEDAVGPLWTGSKFPMAACISGWAMLHKQTVAIPDILRDPRIPKPLYQGTFVRSLLMAPIGVQAPQGAIGAYWSQVYTPSQDERQTLESLAAAAAAALRRLSATAEPVAGNARRQSLGRLHLGRRWLNSISARPLSFWPGQALALGLVAAAALPRTIWASDLGATAMFATFIPAVLTGALFAGRAGAVTAVVASFLSGVALDIRTEGFHHLIPRACAWLIFLAAAVLVAFIASSVRILLDEHREHAAALEQRDLELARISRELDHRVRNTLTIATSLTVQTGRTSSTPAEMSDKLCARLQTLGRAQSLVLGGGANTLTLAELIAAALKPFDHAGDIEVAIPRAMTPPAGVAVSLALAIHELATNALKYGALKQPGGRVFVEADQAEPTHRLLWRETNLHAAVKPSRRGTGTRLITNALTGAPSGRVELNYTTTGVVCQFAWSAPESS